MFCDFSVLSLLLYAVAGSCVKPILCTLNSSIFAYLAYAAHSLTLFFGLCFSHALSSTLCRSHPSWARGSILDAMTYAKTHPLASIGVTNASYTGRGLPTTTFAADVDVFMPVSRSCGIKPVNSRTLRPWFVIQIIIVFLWRTIPGRFGSIRLGPS